MPAFRALIPLVLYALALVVLLPHTSSHRLQAEITQNTSHYYQEALQAEKNKNYLRALEFYRKALQKKPKHLPYQMNSAKVYLMLGLSKQAQDVYRNILTIQPQHTAAQMGLAQVLIHLDELPRAYQILSTLQKKEPSNVENNYSLGLWHTKKGNFKLARLYFDKVLSLEQAHVLSLIQIAYLLIRQNQVLQAKRYLQQATSIDSSHPDIYKIYSYLYLHLFWSGGGKQLDSHYLHNAREVLATAQKLSPQNVNINLELIELDIYLGHYDKAEQTITKLVTQVPLLKTNARLRYLKGLVRLYKLKTISKQELKTVVTDLSKALQFNPDNSFIRHILETTVIDYSAKLGGNKILRSQLAHYHFKKAKEKQANYRRDLMPAHLSRVLYLYPQHKGVLGMQLELLEDAKDYEAILSIHKQLYELNPKNVKLRYRLEKIFQGRKQNIAYREKLFNPFRSTEKSTFQRTPPRIFVFDLLPVSISLQYPDAPRQVARCLNLALQTPGPLASTTEKQRDRAIDYIQAQQTKNPQKTNYSNLHTIFYHSDHLGKLRHILNKGKEKIHYLLSGHYHSSLHGIDKVSLSLRESDTGHIIHRFQVKAAAQETMFHLAMKARKVILKHIPIEGEIIKINRDHEKNEENIFINLGLYDGLQLKNHLILTSLSTTKAALQVEELGAYVSRVSLLKDFATKTLEAGAPVRLLP